jgi:hypothetical protein
MTLCFCRNFTTGIKPAWAVRFFAPFLGATRDDLLFFFFMETVSPQKVNFTINHLNTLPFLFHLVTSLQDLGFIIITGDTVLEKDSIKRRWRF